MAGEDQLRRYRRWYSALLRLYPGPFRERFGESMEQTFADACRAHASAGRGFFGVALRLSIETIGGLVHEHMERLSMRQNSIVRAALVTSGVLLIPLWGIFYVDGWNWGWQAFVRVGAFVFAAALAYQLSVKGMSNKAYRVALGLAVTAAVVLAWMNFVIATSGSLANFAYLGVVLVGIVGAVIARLRAREMALVLAGMAIAQLLVPLIAPVFWQLDVAPGEAVPVVGANAVFIVLFAVSALLFRRAAQAHEIPLTR